MPDVTYYSGPFNMLLRRTATGKDETPVRDRYGDPDGGPSVLVPGKETTAASAIDMALLQGFGKEATFRPTGKERPAWAHTAKGPTKKPEKLTVVKDITSGSEDPRWKKALESAKEEARKQRAVKSQKAQEVAKEQEAFEKAPSKIPREKIESQESRMARWRGKQVERKIEERRGRIAGRAKIKQRLEIGEQPPGAQTEKARAFTEGLKRKQRESAEARKARRADIGREAEDIVEKAWAGRGKREAAEKEIIRRRAKARGAPVRVEKRRAEAREKDIQAELDRLKKRQKRVESHIPEKEATASAGLLFLAEFIKESAPVDPRIARRQAVIKKRKAEAYGPRGREKLKEVTKEKPQTGRTPDYVGKAKEAITEKWGPKASEALKRLGRGAESALVRGTEGGLKGVEWAAEKGIGLGEALGKGLKEKGVPAAKWVGRKAKELAGPGEVTPEMAKQIGFVRPAEYARKSGKKVKALVGAEGQVLSPEDLRKIPKRYRYAFERRISGPGGKVEAEIKPVWGGLPLIGRLAKGKHKIMVGSEAEARGMRPTFGEAARWTAGLPFRAAAAPFVAGVKGVKRVAREVGRVPERLGAAWKGLKGEKVSAPSWQRRWVKADKEGAEKWIAQKRKEGLTQAEAEGMISWKGDEPYIRMDKKELKDTMRALDPEARAKFKQKVFEKPPVSKAERLQARGVDFGEIADAQAELKRLERSPKEFERMKKEHPEVLESLRATAEGARSRRFRRKAEKTEAQARGEILRESPELGEKGREKELSEAIHQRRTEGTYEGWRPGAARRWKKSVREGEVPEGYQEVTPAVPGTKQQREQAKQEKKVRKAAKSKESKMRKEWGIPAEGEKPATPGAAAAAALGERKPEGEMIRGRGEPKPAAEQPADEIISAEGVRKVPSQQPTIEEPAPQPGAPQPGAPQPQAGMFGGQEALRFMAQGGGRADPFSHAHDFGRMPQEVNTVLAQGANKAAKPGANIEKIKKDVLKKVPAEWRPNVEGMFNEWDQFQAARGRVATQQGPMAIAEHVKVPKAWAEEVMQKRPEYTHMFEADPGAPGQMRIGAGAYENLSRTKGITPLAPEAIQRVAPPAPQGAPMPTLAGQGAEPPLKTTSTVTGQPQAQPMGQPGQPGAAPPPAAQQALNIPGIENISLADVLSGAWRNTPQYAQFLEQQGIRQPGGLMQAGLSAAGMMIPYLAAEKLLGANFMGGMGPWALSMGMQQPTQNVLSNIFGYGTPGQEQAAGQQFLNALLARQGYGQAQPMGQPAAAPASVTPPARTPAPR